MKDWVTFIYFKLKGTSCKTDLDDFVDEFDSRHDKRRIKLRWGDDDIQGVHKVLHTLKIFISLKPHMVETLHFRQWIILP